MDPGHKTRDDNLRLPMQASEKMPALYSGK